MKLSTPIVIIIYLHQFTLTPTLSTSLHAPNYDDHYHEILQHLEARWRRMSSQLDQSRGSVRDRYNRNEWCLYLFNLTAKRNYAL